MVVILIPLLVGMMLFIKTQYSASARELAVRPDFVVPPPIRQERSIVPVPTINRAVVRAVNVARSISEEVTAVYISDDPDEATEMRERWERQVPGVPLVIVESPYRALAGPLMAYLNVLDLAWPPDKPDPITFVVIPEYVATHWWERILYNQSARRLRTVLLGRPHTVVVDVPFRRDDPTKFGMGDDETGGTTGASSATASGAGSATRDGTTPGAAAARGAARGAGAGGTVAGPRPGSGARPGPGAGSASPPPADP
jgi:hypothetical protein